jgi:hypothetical protein
VRAASAFSLSPAVLAYLALRLAGPPTNPDRPVEIVKLLVAAAAVTAIHALVLRIATRLMVHVSVNYRRAYQIVAVEYVVAGALLGILLFANLTRPTTAYIIAIVGLLFVGAVYIGRWLTFEGGERLGVGNGVLIQFVQIPLVLPFAILVSFLL